MSFARRKFGAQSISTDLQKDGQLRIIDHQLGSTDIFFDQGKVSEEGGVARSRTIVVSCAFRGASNLVESDPCTKY